MAPVTRRRTISLATGLFGGIAGCQGSRDRADTDHDVRLVNGHDEPHAVHLEITHQGETIHEQRVDAPPGMDAVVYNFRRSPIDGVAKYAVAAEIEDAQRERVEIRTTACYGGTVVSVEEDGTLSVFFSIC